MANNELQRQVLQGLKAKDEAVVCCQNRHFFPALQFSKQVDLQSGLQATDGTACAPTCAPVTMLRVHRERGLYII